MRHPIRQLSVLLLTIAAVCAAPAWGQVASGAAEPPRAELALGYTYVHSNVPPGGCGCFNLNGGNAIFAWQLKPGPPNSGAFALVGDVTAAHASGVSPSGYGLTLSTYTAGARYQPRFGRSSLQPFGQVLAGVAHSAGTLVSGPGFAASNAGAAFAAIVGGGADLHLNRRFSLRLADVDYLLTTVDNGSNNRQNNLRVSTGFVFHF